jgi:hypothetical protein
MRILFIVLAFCSTGYAALGWFAVEFVGGTKFQASMAFGLTVWFVAACLIAIRWKTSAAALAWIGAVIYSVLSWRTDASWVFRDNLERFAFWTPLFLTLATFSRSRIGSVRSD